MFCKRVFIILLIFLVAPQSHASVKDFLRKLGGTHQSNKNMAQVADFFSLSPAPSRAPQFDSLSPASGSYQCHDNTNKMIARLLPAVDGK
ncbi:hypothetical protein LIER_05829 [Lithospermum erythrorhizon]|uniref:Uncharacterized protein n=1 Tax=Lithospermum erythrorhizon TaxID=34254 RepID=A0AAV3P3A0_LITER